MKTRNKALLLVLCAMVLVFASVLGTLAYLTSTDQVTNTFTVGKVHITLDETKVNPDGTSDEGAERVKANEYHLLPGHRYVKDPTVHVEAGSEDCYVRMFLTITCSQEWDEICAQYAKKDAAGNAVRDDQNQEVKIGITDMLTGWEDENWLYQNNTENLAGSNTRTYEFRYKEKVAGGPDSEKKDLDPLFTKIQMPDELTNEDLAKLVGQDGTNNFKIHVVAQAIQADGFEDATAAFEATPAITGDDLLN